MEKVYCIETCWIVLSKHTKSRVFGVSTRDSLQITADVHHILFYRSHFGNYLKNGKMFISPINHLILITQANLVLCALITIIFFVYYFQSHLHIFIHLLLVHVNMLFFF